MKPRQTIKNNITIHEEIYGHPFSEKERDVAIRDSSQIFISLHKSWRLIAQAN